MSNQQPVTPDPAPGTAIGVGIGMLSGLTWIIWALTGNRTWLLIVAIALSMITGFYWGFAMRLFFPNEGRTRNRRRR